MKRGQTVILLSDGKSCRGIFGKVIRTNKKNALVEYSLGGVTSQTWFRPYGNTRHQRDFGTLSAYLNSTEVFSWHSCESIKAFTWKVGGKKWIGSYLKMTAEQTEAHKTKDKD